MTQPVGRSEAGFETEFEEIKGLDLISDKTAFQILVRICFGDFWNKSGDNLALASRPAEAARFDSNIFTTCVRNCNSAIKLVHELWNLVT